MAAARATTDHEEIKRWVEARGGCPAHVKTTGRRRNDPGLLRIDYPGFSGEGTLECITWDEWFKAFDRNHLAFLYTPGRSRFSKLVERETVKRKSARKSSTKRAAPRKTASKAAASRKRTTSTKKRTTSRRAASSS